jgi:4-hydroxy-tetrahydrodipicolinate reductase
MITRIFLNGCFGRMGRTITDIAAASDDLCIAAGADVIAKPADFPVYQDPRLCQEDFDVIIDFSNPAALESVCDLASQRSRPVVICTTGLDAAQQQKIDELSHKVAVFQSANMSLGINLLVSLARQAARLLYPADFDIEILEAHHNQKLDAPSGTALMIACGIDEALGGQTRQVLDRSPLRQKRQHHEIGISAIRGGTIVGEHTVIFAGQEELLTIHHSAQSRNIFARGAIAAARFLPGKPAGLYSMAELIDSQFSS